MCCAVCDDVYMPVSSIPPVFCVLLMCVVSRLPTFSPGVPVWQQQHILPYCITFPFPPTGNHFLLQATIPHHHHAGDGAR